MPSRKTKRTLRRQMPSSKTPIARQLADLANVLGSTKLHAIAVAVAGVEHRAAALDAFMVKMEQDAPPTVITTTTGER